MRKLLHIAIIAVMLTSIVGCKTKQIISYKTDTLIVNTTTVDTFYQQKVKYDSVYVWDSIYVFDNGEMQTKVVYKYQDRWHIKVDTVYKTKLKDSIVYKSKTDSVYVEKQLSKWQRLKVECGEFFMVLCGVLLVIIAINIINKIKK